jgi:hypothetical protein
MKKNKQIEITINQDNIGQVLWYYSRLMLLKNSMYRDYLVNIKEFYKSNKSYLVHDDDPIKELNDLIDSIGEKWSEAFSNRSFRLSRRVMTKAWGESRKKFDKIYKKYPNKLIPPPRVEKLNENAEEDYFEDFKDEFREVFKKDSPKLNNSPSVPSIQKPTTKIPNLKQPLPELGFFEKIPEHNQFYAKNPFIIQPNMPERNKQVKIVEAGIAENVALIKSIPTQFHEQILGSVMRNVAVGGNAKKLVDELSQISDRSSKRIKLIANDQIAKATALLDQQEAIELGFNQVIWKKSIAGKTHRKSHAEANNKEFGIKKGCLIEGEYILPRMKINCKCSYKLIIK